jgi:subtilisin family serine protease
MRKMFSLIAVFVLLFAFAKITSAQTATKRVIVTFKSGVAQTSQDAIISRSSVSKIKRLPLVNSQVVNASQAKIDAIRANPQVLRVEEDAVASALYCFYWNGRYYGNCPPTPTLTPTPTSGTTPTPTSTPTLTPTPTSGPTPTPTNTPTPTYTPTPTPTGSLQPIPWGVDRIDAEKVWDTSPADNIKVAIIDTGIDLDHPDLRANVKGGINTIRSNRSADDDNGHGSHVAGTIAGINNTIGVVGVGHRIDLYAVKVLNSNGSGYISDIIEGIQWSINNGMDVINMSLGTSSNVQSFHDAVIAAKNAGLVVVASAGNSGPSDNTVIYPAKYPEAIAVSAVDSGNNIASFSSRGSEVDLAGPGVSIYSTYRYGGYATLSGTSMAAPHVAGTAALVLSTHPGLTPDQVEQHLEANAEVLPGLTANQQGAGLVDAEKSTLTP